MEEEKLKECSQCGELFNENEINEHGNCYDCEEAILIEIQQVQETQQSLNKYLH